MRDSKPMWVADAGKDDKDYYVAFRGGFELATGAEVEIRTVGSSWYGIWVDGEYVNDGPLRFPAEHPEHQTERVRLAAGKHTIAVQVHHIGLSTRLLVDMPPFLWCSVAAGGKTMPVEWKCLRLRGYASQVRRINGCLGWAEWCDTREVPADWRSPAFDDTDWAAPAKAATKLGPVTAAELGTVQRFELPLKPIAKGHLADMFGYDQDDVPVRFFLRDLAPKGIPPQGVWRRYDLGRVRLGRARLTLDLPTGAVVEIAYCDMLLHGRVSPWVTLSGQSCNLDHYDARGGVQEFFPLTPKGGRFMEVHVIAPPEKVKFVKEEFVERCAYGRPEGSFSCGDRLLKRIWDTGAATYRACSEDALVDCPTRERGEWTGDAVVGMEIGSVAYPDLRLIRRGLVHAAQCARADGLVAGLCPGDPGYLSTYAAQWIGACVRYFELTGDKPLLQTMYPFAERNAAAFLPFLTPEGVKDGLGWAFVDWGYVPNEGPDMAYTMHVLAGMREMARWSSLIGRDGTRYEKLAAELEAAVNRWLTGRPLAKIGYHRAALALGLGLVPQRREADFIAQIKKHMLSCFPNDPEAPRLSDPGVGSTQLITPYFAHYALPPLIERGEMDFVLDQYRKCWGWALGGGRTTWVEVFDVRWSHCHQWAGCPTWQLSRYVLGLQTRFDLGPSHFLLNLRPGSLPSASGAIPTPAGLIRIDWTRRPDGIHYRLRSPGPIHVHVGSQVVAVERRWETVLAP